MCHCLDKGRSPNCPSLYVIETRLWTNSSNSSILTHQLQSPCPSSQEFKGGPAQMIKPVGSHFVLFTKHSLSHLLITHPVYQELGRRIWSPFGSHGVGDTHQAQQVLFTKTFPLASLSSTADVTPDCTLKQGPQSPIASAWNISKPWEGESSFSGYRHRSLGSTSLSLKVVTQVAEPAY